MYGLTVLLKSAQSLTVFMTGRPIIFAIAVVANR